MLEIVTRGSWEAREPKMEFINHGPFQHVFWMSAPREPCFNRAQCMDTMRHMQDFHMTVQNQRDIRYNFIVGGDGYVYEGRGWLTCPMLPVIFRQYQYKSCIIGFVGEYSMNTMSEEMVRTAQYLIDYGIEHGYISKDYENHDIMRKNNDPTIQTNTAV